MNKSIAEIASNDNRSKQTDISNITRSTSESLVKRSKRYIAWHHFHPAAIHYSLSIKNKYNINVLLPKEFVVGTIQIDGNSNGYESADLVEHGDVRAYLMVPSYNKGKAKDDVAKVACTKQLQQTILSVTTGSTTGRRIPTAATRQLLLQQTREHYKTKQLELENKSLQEAIRLLKLQKESPITVGMVPGKPDDDGITTIIAGVNRLTIQSDDYHQHNKKESFEFF